MYQPYSWIDPSLMNKIRSVGGNRPQDVGLYKPRSWTSYLFGGGKKNSAQLTQDMNQRRRDVLSRTLGINFPQNNTPTVRRTGPFAGYYNDKKY